MTNVSLVLGTTEMDLDVKSFNVVETILNGDVFNYGVNFVVRLETDTAIDLIEGQDLTSVLDRMRAIDPGMTGDVMINGVKVDPSLMVAVLPFVAEGKALWDKDVLITYSDPDHEVPFWDLMDRGDDFIPW